MQAQNELYGFVYAEELLQSTASSVGLDVLWETSEGSANFILAIAPQ